MFETQEKARFSEQAMAEPGIHLPELLLVEDDPGQLRLMKSIVKGEGVNVHTATNGQQAFDVAQRISPHLIISDICMPHMDGLELCRRLRSVELERVAHIALTSVNTSPRQLSDCLEAGADLFLPKPFAPADLRSSIKSGLRLHEIYRRLTNAAHTDPLTGLSTRAQFDLDAQKEHERARRHALKLSCVVLDADFFKKVNDTYGHAAGDAVLREIARLVSEQLRQTDICCRFGGEEFCALLPETGIDGARRWADRVRESIERTSVHFNEWQLRVTASIGVSELSDGCESPADLFHKADEALLLAKQTGRNRVKTYRDVIAAETAQLAGCADAAADSFWDLPAGDVMSTVVATLSPDDTLQTSAELFLRFRINAAPVVDEHGALLGIVSEKDVMSRMTRPGGWQMQACEAMNASVISYPESTPIRIIHAFLCRAGIRRVLVMRGSVPVGIIGRATILRGYRNWQHSTESQSTSNAPLQSLCSVVDSITRQADEIRDCLTREQADPTAALIHGTSRIQELSKDLLTAIKDEQSASEAVIAD
ncbi:MAG: diguanylate cyclase [Pirellulales bacterium]|nr:diguanylate cyclase [Pirellulales bacterium]